MINDNLKIFIDKLICLFYKENQIKSNCIQLYSTSVLTLTLSFYEFMLKVEHKFKLNFALEYGSLACLFVRNNFVLCS